MRILVRLWPAESLNGRELPWITLLSVASTEEVRRIAQALQDAGATWDVWEVLVEKEDRTWEVLVSKEKIR